MASLVADGHHVRVLDSLTAQVHGPAARVPAALAGAEWIAGDIRDAARVRAALTEVEAVVHLAAETGVGQSMYEVERYVDVNERGTACLLQGIIGQERPVRLVLASSRAVYGEGRYRCPRCGEVSPPPREVARLEHALWEPLCPRCGGAIDPVATDEEALPRPGSVYAATKLAQEHLCAIVGNAYGLSTTMLRYFNVYGPGQSLSNPYTGILATFAARARGGRAIEIFEDGAESRDFVFIDDVVAATRAALLQPVEARQSHVQVLNIGSGVAVTIADLARAMLRVGGWDVPLLVSGAYRVGDVRHAVADTRRAAQVLGFSATTTVEDGLRRWLAWAADGAYEDGTDAAVADLAAWGLYRCGGAG